MWNSDETSEMISDTLQRYIEMEKYYSESADALNILRVKALRELQQKNDEEDNICDEEFEKELEKRLSRLDELSRSEFYRLRTQRKGVLSAKDLDLLTLEAMERSYNYNKDK